jgi:hypothetical protein
VRGRRREDNGEGWRRMEEDQGGRGRGRASVGQWTHKVFLEEKRALQVREKSRKKQQAILQGKGEHSANTADVRRVKIFFLNFNIFFPNAKVRLGIFSEF